MKVRASIVSGLHEPWKTEEIELDEPHAGEVLVKMSWSGMCHSDEHVRTGDISQEPEVLQFFGVDSMFPLIGGHEGSGFVEAVGPGVTQFAPGDKVAVSFVPACGRCEPCASGRQYLCDLTAMTLAGPMMSDMTWRHHLGDQNVNRMAQLGTFADHMVVNEASLVKIEEWQDLRAAALISCGISTGFGSVVDRAAVQPGEVVAVVGCGGVGSGAIQGARIAGARAVVAIDLLQSKVDRAMKIGATHGATSMLDAAFSVLPDLTFGRNADVVVLTPGVLTGDLIEQARSLCAKGGRVVATAIAPWNQNQVDLNLFNFAMFNQALLGTVFGSNNPRFQIPRLLRLHERGLLDIDTVITNEYTLDEVQKGYADLADGVNVRGIVKFD
jgi:S-(hydroxymethyl)glutathione dehydrogenase/alcohol dehydrogenase